MDTPRLSVVIPTHDRRKYLPSAIRSVLGGMSDVEAVVVPNGQGSSWREVKALFAGDARVRFAPIATPHANAARNHGLCLARGRFVRFLDDDDLLRPEVLARQCDLLDASGADVCSGTVELVNDRGVVFAQWAQPDTNDFAEAMLSPHRVTHVAAHVFVRGELSGLRWDESISLGQDVHWIHTLCRAREWKWAKLDATVGVWQHHPGARISSSVRAEHHAKMAVRIVAETIDVLRSKGRLTANRRAAAAAGMWSLIHSGFYADPLYWLPILRVTMQSFPDTYPNIGLYQHRIGRLVSPALVEWIMLPKRRLNRVIRVAKFRSGRLNAAIPP